MNGAAGGGMWGRPPPGIRGGRPLPKNPGGDAPPPEYGGPCPVEFLPQLTTIRRATITINYIYTGYNRFQPISRGLKMYPLNAFITQSQKPNLQNSEKPQKCVR